MRLRSYTSSGIVLATRDFGEADRIVILYTKDRGKVSVIAKGVRRLKSKKRGHIEVFNLVNFSAISGKGLDTMTEAELIEGFDEIKKSLKKISLGYYMVEVVGKITNEDETNSDLFKLMYNFLTNLGKAKRLKDLRLSFVHDILVLLGYWESGIKLLNPDQKLSEVVERQITSVRVGRKISQ